MRINEIRAGQIFAVERDKRNPKLKLNSGFVDMLSEAKHDERILAALEVQPMSNHEIRLLFKWRGMSTKDWKYLRKRLLEKYNRLKERRGGEKFERRKVRTVKDGLQ